MTVQFTFEPEEDYLYAKYIGEYDLNTSQEFFQRILEAANQHGSQKVFADIREVTGKISIAEKYTLGKTFSEWYLQQKLSFKLAFLGTEDIIAEGMSSLTAKNRGFNFLSTTSLEEAINFLEIDYEDS